MPMDALGPQSAVLYLSRLLHFHSMIVSVKKLGVQVYLYTLESTLESRLASSGAQAQLPSSTKPNACQSGTPARHQEIPSQYMLLVMKGGRGCQAETEAEHAWWRYYNTRI